MDNAKLLEKILKVLGLKPEDGLAEAIARWFSLHERVDAEILSNIFGRAYELLVNTDDAMTRSTCLKLYIQFEALSLLPDASRSLNRQVATNFGLLMDELMDIILYSATVKEGIGECLKLLRAYRRHLLYDGMDIPTILAYDQALEDLTELYESFDLFGDEPANYLL